MIRHAVLLAFHDPSAAPEAQARLAALPARISEILSLEVGLDVVGSPASAHLLLLTTHESVETLQAYQAHPAHQEFVTWLGPRLAARAIADIEV